MNNDSQAPPPSNGDDTPSSTSRRDALRHGGAVLAGLLVGPSLAGCAETGAAGTDDIVPAPDTSETGFDSDASADVQSDAPVDADGPDSEVVDAAPESVGPPPLASGGTQSVSGAYRDPFEGVPPTECALTCEQTGGPCYATSPFRRDISAGKTGLPMRLALRIVTEGDCSPVANADVELWGCDVDGIYSGQTPSPICAGEALEARDQDFMRGRQTTNAQGRVDFDLVLPGWYPTRAPHLHLRVNVGGDAYATTQLYFDEGLVDPIYQTHPDYKHRGMPATTQATDGIIGGRGPALPFVPAAEVTSEGALLMWMDIGLRSNLAAPTCEPGGG